MIDFTQFLAWLILIVYKMIYLNVRIYEYYDVNVSIMISSYQQYS